MKKIKRVIIVNSYYYYGGTLVLSELCRCLNKQGIDARLFLLHSFPTNQNDLKAFSKRTVLFTNIKLIIAIFLNRTFPSFKISRKFFPEFFQAPHLKECKIQINPYFSNSGTIVIYPEIIYGNPLNAKNVARWFLFYNRYPNDEAAYNKNEMFFCYRELFNDNRLNPGHRMVKINFFDKNLYRQTNFSQRRGTCYIIRKGHNRPDLPQKFDGVIIDSLSEEEKVETFNRCEYCYCYDTQTFYSCIASVCGCKTIIIPEPGKTRRDYRVPNETPLYGIAYGNSEEELEWAMATRKKLINTLDYDESNIKNTLSFIKYIEEFFLK